MAEMADVASRKGLKRKAPASDSVPSSQLASSHASSSSQAIYFMLQIPDNINTNLPVWEAIKAQQLAVVCTVTPYIVNIGITPVGPTQRKASAANPTKSGCLVHQIGPQAMSQQPSNAGPVVRILISQNAALPTLGSSCQLVQDSCPIIPLPLLITQGPTSSAPPAKKATLAVSPPMTMSRLRPLCDRSLFHTKSTKDILICDDFLAGSCHKGRRCQMHHTPFPFHWQLLSKGKEWVDINPASQVMLERVYCNAQRSSICLKNGDDLYTLYFDQMRLQNNTEYSDIRRLSNLHFPNEWKIYWESPTNWVEYDQVKSALLLQKMKLNEPECYFNIESERHTVDFNLMIDTETGSKFTKRVRCRPVYRSLESLQPYLRAGLSSELVPNGAKPPDPNFSVDPLEEFSSWYPPVWHLPMEQDYSLVDVPEGTQTFRKVKKLFHESMSESSVDIISIQQVQNVLHWDKYQRQKASMLKLHRNSKQPLERHLFHGTTKNAAGLICQNNFDPRLAGINGARYGLGSYFATTASQSSIYTCKVVDHNVGHIFLAKVLVGNMSLGKKSYRRPPPLSAKTRKHCLYDTCVDNLENPIIFVVFNSCQCFPYYLIKYKDLPDEIDMMAEMTDDASRKGLERKVPVSDSLSSSQAPSPQLSSSQALSFLLEIPADINTNLPVWDAIRAQQTAMAWTVNPYIVNISITPMGATQGKSSGPNPSRSGCLMQQIILQSMSQPKAVAAPGVRVHVSQNAASLRPSSSYQSVPDSGFIGLLPLLITQQPTPITTLTLAVAPPLTMSRLRPLSDRSLFHTKSANDLLICDRFLAGSCRMGRRCRMHHTPFPFHWQLLSKGKEWVDINPASQVMLERVYCNVKRSRICLKNGVNRYSLFFDTMELENNTEYNGIRRLSNMHFPSGWKIYWRARTNWIEYDKVTSTLLLQKMKLNNPECHFLTDSEKYMLNFNLMNQLDIRTGYTKKVRCRPVYRSLESLQPYLRAGLPSELVPYATEPLDPNFSVDPLEEFSSWYPPVWRLPMEQDYSLVDVPEGTQAFHKVKKLFHESMSESSVDIISIQQVQNVLHWDKYQRQKASMQKLHSNSKHPLERHLFHGTTRNAAGLICQNNFDPRLAGVNGAMYGLGSYFATTASQSRHFTGKVVAHNVGHIFLAKVLAGNISLGKKSYRRPPPLCAHTKHYRLYDTCVDRLDQPTMFVVFDSCQCFPYYLIKYKDLPDEIDM